MKIPVKIEDGGVTVGDRFVPLLSGTFHYWRVHPESWKDVLASIQDMGLQIIETYIPWEYHENKPGEFDFIGKSDNRKDLIGFLDMCREMNFWLLIRPGPFIYSEWVNMGVPDDVLAYHRLHPQFKQRAEPWLKAVSEILIPYLATNGGNILLLQPDNEADTFDQVYSDQLGLTGTPGMFQQFLRERYKDNIEELNKCWNSHYKTFNEAYALMVQSDLVEEYRQRYIDFFA